MSRGAIERLERVLGSLLLVLVVFMPFHAFLSVWLGSITGYQTIVQAWKEVVTLLLVIGTAVIITYDRTRLSRLKPIIYIPAIIFALCALAVTSWHNPGISAVLYGIKTDFEMIVLFGVAILVFPAALLHRLTPIILATSGVVAVLAIALVTILPVDTLVHFGYGVSTIDPFAFVGSAQHLVRTPSTLGGPNQLGSFLILPLTILLGVAMRKRRWWHLGLGALFLGALYVTYSRSAWIGAAIALVITAIATVRSKRRAAAIAGAVVMFSVLAGVGLLAYGLRDSTVQNYLFHATSDLSANANSTALHGVALSTGLSTVLDNPLGLGLGSAGPASFHAANGLIPENYYLQLAIETGIIGSLAFIGFCFAIGWELWRNRRRLGLAPPVLGTLAGISIVSLFLHGWADSSTSFIFMIVAGATLSGANNVKADPIRQD